MVLQT